MLYDDDLIRVQSKVDAIQLLFYLLLGAPTDQNTTRAEFYYASNEVLEVTYTPHYLDIMMQLLVFLLLLLLSLPVNEGMYVTLLLLLLVHVCCRKCNADVL
jgi:hypothetical protein